MKRKKLFLMLLFFLLLLTYTVTVVYALATARVSVAAPTTTSTKLNDSYVALFNKTVGATTVTLSAINASTQTNHWSAFIGNITLEVMLATVGNEGIKKLLNYTTTVALYESIAATTTQNPSWANYKAVNTEVVDFAINLAPSTAPDSATNMYNDTSFSFGGVSLNTTYLNDNSSKPNSQWANGIATTASSGTSYTANSGIENLVFLTRINSSKSCTTWLSGAAQRPIDSGGNNSCGTTPSISAQFQLIIGVNETNETTDIEPGNRYYFFLLNP